MGLTASISSILVVGTLTLWFGIDAYLIYKKGEQGSISFITTYYSMRWPIIPAAISLLLGALIGHLWWRNDAWCVQ